MLAPEEMEFQIVDADEFEQFTWAPLLAKCFETAELYSTSKKQLIQELKENFPTEHLWTANKEKIIAITSNGLSASDKALMLETNSYVGKQTKKLTEEEIEKKKLRRNIQQKVRDWVNKLKIEMGYEGSRDSTPRSDSNGSSQGKGKTTTAAMAAFSEFCLPRSEIRGQGVQTDALFKRMDSFGIKFKTHYNPYQEAHGCQVPLRMLFVGAQGKGKVSFHSIKLKNSLLTSHCTLLFIL